MISAGNRFALGIGAFGVPFILVMSLVWIPYVLHVGERGALAALIFWFVLAGVLSAQLRFVNPPSLVERHQRGSEDTSQSGSHGKSLL